MIATIPAEARGVRIGFIFNREGLIKPRAPGSSDITINLTSQDGTSFAQKREADNCSIGVVDFMNPASCKALRS